MSYSTSRDHSHAVMATSKLVVTLISSSVGLPDRGRMMGRKRFVRQEIDWGTLIAWGDQMEKKRRLTDARHADMFKT